MAILQLTVIPIGTKTCSVGNYVSAIQNKLIDMGVPFALNDTGTVIEGDAKNLLQTIASIYETPFDQGAVRVVTQITIDDRRDKEVKIGDKIQSVIRRTKTHTST